MAVFGLESQGDWTVRHKNWLTVPCILKLEAKVTTETFVHTHPHGLTSQTVFLSPSSEPQTL
jgi:hypothetical protein